MFSSNIVFSRLEFCFRGLPSMPKIWPPSLEVAAELSVFTNLGGSSLLVTSIQSQEQLMTSIECHRAAVYLSYTHIIQYMVLQEYKVGTKASFEMVNWYLKTEDIRTPDDNIQGSSP